MYDYISGILVALSADSVVLEAGGIGYRIAVPRHSGQGKWVVGQLVRLYTSLLIREQAHTLVGFATEEERALFEQLLTVSGVGPKIALNAIGHLGTEGIAQAVQGAHGALLAKVPGIGKKTAERLILELKGKIMPTGQGGCPMMLDAHNVLLNLGCQPHIAQRALMQAQDEIGQSSDLSHLVACALRLAKSMPSGQ